MARVNRAVELLAQGQPVYYASTHTLTYANGVAMAQTWADYIRIDSEHGPFDMTALSQFMNGLIAGGPTRSGHRCPAVIAELPFDGISTDAVLANAWMIKQALAQGVHGLILCHAETPGAVQAYVESARYAFQALGVGKGLGPGRRGHGGQSIAAPVWGVSEAQYLETADPWPLNPNGELILGIKMENPRALINCEVTARVPGITFGEWGAGDMSMAYGHRKRPVPLPPDLQAIMDRVWKACGDAGVYFLTIVTPEDVTEMIDRGLRFCRAYDPKAAEIGRAYTKRQMPV
jgi:4-hydroxy-2-oxoheptanedioate aldolase